MNGLETKRKNIETPTPVKKKKGEQKWFFKSNMFGPPTSKQFEWTPDEFKQNQSQYPQLCDDFAHQGDDHLITPFADYDCNYATKDEMPDEETEQKIRTEVTEEFRSLFLNEKFSIITAYRDQGSASNMKLNKQTKKYEEKGKWKISFRMWAHGLSTTRLELQKTMQVYDVGRSMNFIGKYKTFADKKRILKRTDENEPLEHFIIQNVPDGAELAQWNRPIEEKKTANTKQPKRQSYNFGFLNKHFTVSVNWQVIEGKDGSFQLIPDMLQCLVDPTHNHSEKGHSCLYITARTVTLSCFAHGKEKLGKLECKRLLENFRLHILGEKKKESNDMPFDQLRNTLLNVGFENNYKRDGNGNVWKSVDGLMYAYELFEDPKTFLNRVFLDDDLFHGNQDNVDRFTKYMRDFDHSKFPFIKKDRHYLGFANGVLNIVTCEFLPKEKAPDSLCVRKYFASDLDTSRTDTPLFESILRYQYQDEDAEEFQGIYNFLLMSIGRMFFKINERDTWQYMPYLEGTPGSGKLNIMNIIRRMFDKVGSMSEENEKQFCLSSLYDQELVLIDDLPPNFKDVFPQTTFQTAVSGGLLPVRIMRTTAFSVMWAVPFIFAGNWSADYLDKGQVTRHIIRFLFEHPVKKSDCDPTLESRIVENELAPLIYKCLCLYKEYFEKHNGEDVWKFCPGYFRETQTEMRAERNPLNGFLTSEQRFVYEESGAETPLHEIKRAFEVKFVKKPCKALDRGTFAQANNRWEVKQPKFCKHCKAPHKKGCCASYTRADRTCGNWIVTNLRLNLNVFEDAV
ncbi:hypothetical protein HK104_000996 [Borealophlyctis nickersoniae]|nr:hypothetical protein HK104_000996 [Borealophlyctis nickersoniae]